ncbi:MAG: hypothetical protein WCJ14_08460 [Verrucomicrobiota bacterium]
MPLPPISKLIIPLSGGLSAEVGITILDEPNFPTPCEPDVRRAPTAVELHQIAMAIVRTAYQQFQ